MPAAQASAIAFERHVMDARHPVVCCPIQSGDPNEDRGYAGRPTCMELPMSALRDSA
jgi:hypothetical protein